MCQHMKFCHKEVGRKEEQEKREKSLANFCMNHTHEVREITHFGFVGHVRLGRASFHKIFSVLHSKGEEAGGRGERKRTSTKLPPIVTKGILALTFMRSYK